MLQINSIEELNKISVDTAVALGTFDGLHIGHQAVLNDMIETAHKNGLSSCVLTFQNHPKELTSSSPAPQRILAKHDKVELLEYYGVDILIMLPFDHIVLNMKANDFIDNILVGAVHAKHIFAGFDYRFGHRATGDVNMLKQCEQAGGYEFHLIEPVLKDGKKISSSSIRKLLFDGDVEEVLNQLGRHHFVSGMVVRGKELGNKLGFPTANLKMSDNMSLIRPGVYVTRTLIEGKMHNSITNVGYNPTFDEPFKIETHILNYDKMIYGEQIEVFFYKRLRDEKKFTSYDELVKSIENDRACAEAYFEMCTGCSKMYSEF